MNVIVTKSYEDSCQRAAELIEAAVLANPQAKLGLATGGTPLPIYRRLIEDCKAGKISFAKVRTVNLDEYCGLNGSNTQSYRWFMDHNLFNEIDIDKTNTYVPSGLGDLAANCREVDKKVRENGVPELQLLGIGNNGHIGFNEAADLLHTETHIEQLTESTIAANARFFDKPEAVPTQAITMGLSSILAAKSIVLVATGAAKAAAIRGLLCNDEVTTQNPSTFLKLHPNATVIIDAALATAAGYEN